MRFAWVLGASQVFGVLIGACTITATPPGDEMPMPCGVTLSWKQDSTACQGWMNQNCCTQLRACAGDGTCSSLVRCINACPVPRTEACVGTCIANSIPMVLDPISTCSKQMPPAVASSIPSQCAWP